MLDLLRLDKPWHNCFNPLRGVYSDTTQLNSTDLVEQRTAKSVRVFVYDVVTYKLSQLGHYVQ